MHHTLTEGLKLSSRSRSGMRWFTALVTARPATGPQTPNVLKSHVR